MRKTVFAICIAASASAANAQSICGGLVGRTVAPITVEDAIARFADLTPKGEFETTAQFRARRAAAEARASEPLVIAKAVEDQKYLEYDADRELLAIKSYAFDNTGFDSWSAFSSAGLRGKVDVSTTSNLEVVISTSDRPVGSYVASNAFGAKVNVLRIDRTTTAIFERKANGFDDSGLFPAADKSPYIVGTLKLTPDEAQRIKPTLKVAFVVVPKEPYRVVGSHRPYKVTIHNPRDITENFSILVADFKCGLILDGANKVLGSYPTR